jgi:hypothetical protein
MRLNPYRILLNNLKEKYHPDDASTRRIYETRDEAYNMLKSLTEQDFGYDIEEWEKWLKDNKKLKLR